MHHMINCIWKDVAYEAFSTTNKCDHSFGAKMVLQLKHNLASVLSQIGSIISELRFLKHSWNPECNEGSTQKILR